MEEEIELWEKAKIDVEKLIQNGILKITIEGCERIFSNERGTIQAWLISERGTIKAKINDTELTAFFKYEKPMMISESKTVSYPEGVSLTVTFPQCRICGRPLSASGLCICGYSSGNCKCPTCRCGAQITRVNYCSKCPYPCIYCKCV